mmetsp:Transcript_21351/g.33019  ORF Transcript_21351/g.33019 Transcript_21351/m.33019 type:complete len:105 (+) Transcript_21351:995-1309(+)
MLNQATGNTNEKCSRGFMTQNSLRYDKIWSYLMLGGLFETDISVASSLCKSLGLTFGSNKSNINRQPQLIRCIMLPLSADIMPSITPMTTMSGVLESPRAALSI